jgi:hypothetical protein
MPTNDTDPISAPTSTEPGEPEAVETDAPRPTAEVSDGAGETEDLLGGLRRIRPPPKLAPRIDASSEGREAVAYYAGPQSLPTRFDTPPLETAVQVAVTAPLEPVSTAEATRREPPLETPLETTMAGRRGRRRGTRTGFAVGALVLAGGIAALAATRVERGSRAAAGAAASAAASAEEHQAEPLPPHPPATNETRDAPKTSPQEDERPAAPEKPAPVVGPRERARPPSSTSPPASASAAPPATGVPMRPAPRYAPPDRSLFEK